MKRSPTHKLPKRILSVLTCAALLSTVVACDVHEPPPGQDDGTESMGGHGGDQGDVCGDQYDGKELYRGIFFGVGPVAEKVPELWSDGKHRERAERAHEYLQEKGVDVDLDPFDADLANPLVVRQLASLVDERATETENNGEWERADTLSDLAQAMRSVGAGEKDCDTSTEAFVEIFLAFIDERDPEYFDRFATEMQSGDPIRVDNAMREAGRKIIGTLQLMSDAGLPLPNIGDVSKAPDSPLTCFAVAGVVALAAVAIVAVAVDIAAVVNVEAVYNEVAAWKFVARSEPDSNLKQSEFVAHLTGEFDCTCGG